MSLLSAPSSNGRSPKSIYVSSRFPRYLFLVLIRNQKIFDSKVSGLKEEQETVIPNRSQLKKLAHEHDLRVKEVLALTPKNDPFYIRPNHLEKAEWFAKIWKDQGRPQIHPRGLHYQILGEGYTLPGKDEEYQNTERCWNYLLIGAKYARILGLVPYDRINDEKNPNPRKNMPSTWEHEFTKEDVSHLSSFSYRLKVHSLLEFDDTDGLLEELIDATVEELFRSVDYSPAGAQPNYLEIWAEKQNVIPEDVAREFNATMRPAGGGEMSLDMCFDAVREAKKLDKDLHLFLLVDFDPKGRDMPRSVARKVERIAKEMGVTAYVHHVTLTREQCQQYALPTVPAKQPRGDSTGAKAYRTHTEIFRRYAGQEPTELNSFMSREPRAYKEALRKAIQPYFDGELNEKYEETLDDFREEVEENVKDFYEEKKEDINEKRKKIRKAIKDIKEKLEEIEGDLSFEEKFQTFEEVIQFSKDALEDLEFERPDVETVLPDNALLDTTRSYLEQIKKYKEFDIR